MNLQPGSRLGRYEILSPLGAGGMGEVYVARDADLERDVAIKILRSADEDSPDRVRRFVQEAKAASALNHPNVAYVYEIGSSDELRYIVMEIVGGETLRERIRRERMQLDDVLSIGTQIAAALAAAHGAGIVHRDIKPDNVIVRPDGYVKVLDFGLAKLSPVRAPDADTLLRTEPGVIMGTLRYMAPEQLSGEDVGPAADVFSLGVVFYEMISGRRPFEGTSPMDVAASILSNEPVPLVSSRPDTPPKLISIVSRALAKRPEDRYRDAGAMLEDLKSITRETSPLVPRSLPPASRLMTWRRAAMILAAALVIGGIFGGALYVRRERRASAGRSALASAERFLSQHSFAEALENALAAEALLPGNQRAGEIIGASSCEADFRSDPPGATVYAERFKGKGRLTLGVTPFKKRLPLADFVVTFEKQGFAAAVRPLPLEPQFNRGFQLPGNVASLSVKLAPASAVPSDMVLVDGGEYRLTGWSRASDRAVELHEFLIDRFEVSNESFEQFVRAGGYRRREFWRHPFVDNGRTLTFDEAMARMRDKTGLPGPRDWAGGAPPAGYGKHPVSGVTWYEAEAFAAWKGKELPTTYEWEKAGRYSMKGAVGTALPWGVAGEGLDVTERANFSSSGTVPVDALPFGISPYGAYNMAGNVTEWCRNARAPGYVARGGSWNDPVYAFGGTAAFPAFYSSPTLGFRCVKELGPADQGGFELAAVAPAPDYKPVDDAAFARILDRYSYEKTLLNAKVDSVAETADWRRERIVFRVAGKDVPAYLYLPKGFRPPYQVIYFSPAGDVASGQRPLPASVENFLGPLIRSGRAVFSVVLEGFNGRPSSVVVNPDSRSDEYVDFVVGRVTELRRGIDYIETRRDLDTSRIAFVGPSAGSWAGLILTGVEKRFRSVLFVGTQIKPSEVTDAAAANRINFAPHISGPKMMLQGRYDESAPLETAARPLFNLLRDPKRLEVYDGSHSPEQEVFVPAAMRWLDETLGPVAH